MELEIDSSIETALNSTKLERYLQEHNFTLEEVMWYTPWAQATSIWIIVIRDGYEDRFKQYIGNTNFWDTEEDSILRILQYWAKFYPQHYEKFIPKT